MFHPFLEFLFIKVYNEKRLKRDIGDFRVREKTMLKKLTAFLTAAVMVTSVASIPVLTSYADTNSTTEKRVMEKLDRGTVAVKTNDGVYLSWRLLGTESLTNQAFDIYRDSEKIYTTGEHDATCYTDSKGTADNKYTVVPKGEAIDKTEAGDVWDTKTNLEKRKDAECGACEDKKRIATRAKQLNLDAIHDTVHEMCKDEARHGKGFEGLYNRYFK